MSFSRYVAIGDSSTEGLEDPDADGRYRGWADRLAEHVARAQREPLLYANLAIRGRNTRAVLEEQLAPALEMRPDLATVFAGTNDIIRRRFALEPVIADLRTMQQALRDAGATVLTITMPDLSEVAPLTRGVSSRLLAFNDGVREISAETGTLVVDLARYPVAADPRLWHEDRLHANGAGHARIAAALADALGVPNGDPAWRDPLPAVRPASIGTRLQADLRWISRYFLPWAIRHLRGRSSGDGVTAKRPSLTPVNVS